MEISTKALVVKTKSFKDDRIIFLLTEDMGVIRAYGRQANRPKSKLAGATEMLCYSNFILEKNKDGYKVISADHIRLFFGIRQDIEKLSLAAYLCELIVLFCQEGEETTEQLRLILNSLHLLEQSSRDLLFLKSVFEMRLATLSGYMPDLVGCNSCGHHDKLSYNFYYLTGNIICSSCTGNPHGDYLTISQSALNGLRHIIYSPFDKLFSFTLGKESQSLINKVSQRYLLDKLEFAPKTLAFLQDILQ